MKKAIIAGIICLAFLSINCGKGTRASVNAMVYLEDTGGQTVEPQFSIEIYKDDGFNYIPMITVNSETLATEWNTVLPYGSAETYDYSCIIDWINPAGDFNMTADYGEGRGQVKDSLPGFFTITDPQSGTPLQINENLDISWNTSQCASWYWLFVHIHYVYVESDSITTHEYVYQLDTIVHERNLTVQADDIFPNDAYLILYDYGDTRVYVAAYTGPDPEPLAKGNVTGDAVGFFWAYYDQAVYFDVSQQPAQGRPDVPVDPSARHRQILLDWAHEQ